MVRVVVGDDIGCIGRDAIDVIHALSMLPRDKVYSSTYRNGKMMIGWLVKGLSFVRNLPSMAPTYSIEELRDIFLEAHSPKVGHEYS